MARNDDCPWGPHGRHQRGMRGCGCSSDPDRARRVTTAADEKTSIPCCKHVWETPKGEHAHQRHWCRLPFVAPRYIGHNGRHLCDRPGCAAMT